MTPGGMQTAGSIGMSILDRLEFQAIHILREVAAQCRAPVLLYSIGKDSSVLLDLALKAFAPAPLPFPLLHIDTGWKFREMIAHRDETARRHGLRLIVHTNEAARAQGINPFDHGAAYTRAMKTDALKQALAAGGFDAAFGGARRDEERSRAKERVVSVRDAAQGWDPKAQRPEFWDLYNARPTARRARCGPSLYPTGPRATCGATSSARPSRCPALLRPARCRWWSATAP